MTIAARVKAAAAVSAVVLTGCGSQSPPRAHPRTIEPITGMIGGSPGQPKGLWGTPTNRAKPKAVVILIHGGSWAGIDPVSFQSMVATSGVFRSLGLETLTVDYRRGAQGIDDVQHLYEQARQRVGAGFPICAAGVSAGGHIALMLAVRKSDLACAISVAGPTDLPALRTEPNGNMGYNISVGAFGTAALDQLSPARHAGSIKARLLLQYAQTDHLVPVSQGHDMARADPRAELIVLPPGGAPFVHTGIGAPGQKSGVDATAYLRAQQEQVRFLNAVAASG